MEANKSKIVNQGWITNPGTINSYRITPCSDEFNKRHNIDVKCADEQTIRDELKQMFVIPNEIRADLELANLTTNPYKLSRVELA